MRPPQACAPLCHVGQEQAPAPPRRLPPPALPRMIPSHVTRHQVAEVIDDVVRAPFAQGPLIVPKTAGVFLCRMPNLGAG